MLMNILSFGPCLWYFIDKNFRQNNLLMITEQMKSHNRDLQSANQLLPFLKKPTGSLGAYYSDNKGHHYSKTP